MIVTETVKKSVFLFLSIASVYVWSSCASAPKKNSVVIGQTASGSFEGNLEEKTSINSGYKDKNKGSSSFANVPESIMADLENGSASSVKKAASTVRRTEFENAETQKQLLALCYGILEIAWPSERIDFENPSLGYETLYTGAITFAKTGIYDTSTGSSDFLSLVLPSLAVLKTNDVSSFFTESETALKNALQKKSDSVLANYLFGVLYQKSGKKEQALPYLKKAREGEPESLEVVSYYATLLYDTGSVKEAYSLVSSLASKYPSDAKVLKLCAEFSYAAGDLENAEQYISRVLQQDPNDLPSVLFRAKILIEKKDYIHAASLLDVYSRQDSTSKNYLLLRAQVQSEWSKNITAASSTIENALKRYPQDTEVLLFAARLASVSNQNIAGKSAEDYASQVLEKEPQNETALRYAVEGLIRKKNWNSAYSVSSNLVSKRSAEKETVFNHIKICLALKKNDEAWNLISPLYKNFPNDEEIIQNYILVQVSSGRVSQAQTLIAQLLPSSSAKLKSFLYYERSFLQNSEEAVLSDLRSSLIANPRNSDSLFRLYEVYFSKKDYRKAQYYLKQVAALNPNDGEIKRLNEELSSLIR